VEESEEIVTQKRQAAIKLAKNLEPFNHTLGQEFDAVYVETLTEDIKQLAREMKKLAKVVAVADQYVPSLGNCVGLPLTVQIDGEEERVTKLMRRYCTRIQKMADLIYEVAYMDFEGLEQEEIKNIMEVEGEDDDE
jgi:ribosomal protein S6